MAIFALSNTLPFRFGSLTSTSWNAPWVEVKEYGLNEFHIFTMSAGGSGIWNYLLACRFKKKKGDGGSDGDKPCWESTT